MYVIMYNCLKRKNKRFFLCLLKRKKISTEVGTFWLYRMRRVLYKQEHQRTSIKLLISANKINGNFK